MFRSFDCFTGYESDLAGCAAPAFFSMRVFVLADATVVSTWYHKILYENERVG